MASETTTPVVADAATNAESAPSTGQTTDGVTLAECFAEAKALYNAITRADRRGDSDETQEAVRQLLELLKTCRARIRSEATFSRNEDTDDLRTEDLQYLLVDYYTAQALCWKSTRGRERIPTLHAASASYTAFLSRCEDYGLIHPDDSAVLDRESAVEIDPERRRAMKIERFKRERAAKAAMEELEKRIADAEAAGREVDDDTLRQRVFIAIESAARQAVDELGSLEQERELLSMLPEELGPDGGRGVVDEPPPPPSGGLEVTHIDENFQLTREVIRGQVFQPDHILPTMSLEEYAKKEMEDAMARQAAEQDESRPKGPRRIEHLERDGDEDDAKLVEEAAYHDRRWDDWKDEHEKGAGNKMVNRG